MDLRFTDAELAFRAEAREWLEANVPTEPLASHDTAEGFAQHVHWEKQLHAAGWAVVSWPKVYGGREATLVEWLIFEEEYYRAGAPARVTQNGIFLLAPTLFEFGTQAQKDDILPAMAAAETLWAQGWSEPNSGSDLASLKSTAVRDEAAGGWRLSGQKCWCSRGAFSDAMYGLFRTDLEAERPHKGMTYFMVPLDAPGVTVRAVQRLDGDEAFADVFLEDVFVADDAIIGEVNRGWYVAMATTNSERGLTLRSPGRFMATATRLIELYADYAEVADAGLREQVVQAWMDAQAYRLYTYQTVAQMTAGTWKPAESSLNKLWWSELDVRMHETALALMGAAGELDTDWMRGFEFALAGPIYAGTNEIQRNIAARRLLGLPGR